MNSFISSFRSVLAALAIIAVIETLVFVKLHPSDAERSNYLGLNYLTPEHGHRFLIYEKLKNFGESHPDIIQVGDSSGHYGVNPDIVMQYLNGLTYINLSCCANTGFDGYYAIADYMFRHNKNIKALVLYMGLDNLPRKDLISGDTGAGAIHAAFDSVWSYFMPPSIVLRWRIINNTYTLGGILHPRKSDFSPNHDWQNVDDSIRQHHGWASEMDPRYAGTALTQYWERICGPNDKFGLDSPQFYTYDFLWRGQSVPLTQYTRFAELTQRYGAKLIIITQPFACSNVYTDQLAIRVGEIKTIQAKYPNVILIPKTLFFHWPREDFTSLPHMRIGYEVPNSHRIGQALASVFHIVPPKIPTVPVMPIPLTIAAAPFVWQEKQLSTPEWILDGATIQPIGIGTQITERTSQGWHRVMVFVKKVKPGVPYIFSVVFKSQDRSVKLEMRDKNIQGRYGSAICDPKHLTTVRYGDSLDADMEILPDGSYKCWASMTYNEPDTAYSIALNQEQNSIYEGNGKSGILLYETSLQPGGRLVAVDKKIVNPETKVQTP